MAAGGRTTLPSVDVIVTHTNTDFDALAAMLAARRLYPGAVDALSGSAEPQRAGVLPPARGRAGRRRHRHARPRRDPAAGRRRDRAPRAPGRVRGGRARSGRRGRRLRPPRRRGARLDRRGEPRALGGRRPDDDDGRDPRRAGDRADAARGDRLRARDPRGHGLARRTRASASGTPRRSPGACATAPGRRWSRSTCTRRSREEERALLDALVSARRGARRGRASRCS